MTKVGILGTTGMLGSTLAAYLTPHLEQVVEINRSGSPVVPENKVIRFDAAQGASIKSYLHNEKFDFVINAVGLIKQHINDNDQSDITAAYKVNSDLPGELNEFAKHTSTPIIQIGTDCVYSGLSGNYSENSEFDCSDIYGLSKVSGEAKSKSLMTIRCSIIGHEKKPPVSLMDWFLSQSKSALVSGYTNHFWNGLTTLSFARVVEGIIRQNRFSPGVVHLVPRDQISKFDLLHILAKEFGRDDIDIRSFETEFSINRTLTTLFPDKNAQFWLNAGYSKVPSVREMIEEYANWSL